MIKQKIKNAKLSEYASRVLRWTLPIVLLQMIYFTLFVASRSGYELAGSGELISLMIEQIGKSLILSVYGSLIFDLIEKREKRKT